MGAGLIGGALSPVMNPISGRASPSDMSLIASFDSAYLET
jgi:hypothetical protein